MERPAPDWLRGRVVKYRGRRTPGGMPARLTLPATTVTLIVGWGDPLHLFGPDGGGSGGGTWYSLVGGLRTSPVLGGYQGSGQAVEVDFTPLGAYMFLGISMHELANETVHPDELLGKRWTARLTERLAAAPDWEARWAMVDEALASRLLDGPHVSPVVAEAWQVLSERHGGMSLGELAGATGRGGRRLQVLFREQIGLPIQSVARILRFQRALTLPHGSHASLAELAAACGYYDQAHLNRDFKALAGLTPAQLCGLASHAALDGTAAVEGGRTSVFNR
ncbi:helix-turn-helix domain-containing protein [Streptomyces sp. NPDC059070]|uniref:helix-turn-helix domain-containing protein n=1 Tax=unclassified Streptomyces TaxID=2593676 RepID=UPI0034E2C9D6